MHLYIYWYIYRYRYSTRHCQQSFPQPQSHGLRKGQLSELVLRPPLPALAQLLHLLAEDHFREADPDTEPVGPSGRPNRLAGSRVITLGLPGRLFFYPLHGPIAYTILLIATIAPGEQPVTALIQQLIGAVLIRARHKTDRHRVAILRHPGRLHLVAVHRAAAREGSDCARSLLHHTKERARRDLVISAS